MTLWRSYNGLLFLLLATLATAGCGGGGGGESSPPPQEPPPGSDTTVGTLALHDGNSEAIALGLSLSEGVLAFTQMAVNASIRFASDVGVPQFSCTNGGTLAVVHDDNDASFDISAGDVLHVSMSNCFDSTIDGIGSGGFDVTITGFALDQSAAHVSGQLSVPTPFGIENRFDPTLATQLTAALDFDFRLQAPEVLSVEASGNQFLSVGSGDITETITDFSLTKSATRIEPEPSFTDIETEIVFSLFYDSGLLGGTFTCVSADFRYGATDTVPMAAEIQCTGRDRSAVRITDRDQVELDPEGDGSFEVLGRLDWSQTVDQFLRSDSGLVLADLLGDLSLRRVTITANDVAYDAVRDRVLITTDASDPVIPWALVELSLSSNSRRVAIAPFPSEPDLVRVSDDGSFFYVSFEDSATIRRYDAATLQQVSVIQMQTDKPFSSQPVVIDMAVSPLDPNVVAVVFGFAGGSVDLAIVDGETQLAGALHHVAPNETGIRTIAYSQDGTRIFAAGGIPLVLDVDAGGIASVTWVPDAFSQFVKLQRVGDRLYSGPVAMDGQSLVRVGTYTGSGNPVGIDQGSNFAFRYGEERLTVYQRDRFVPLASYRLRLNQAANIRDIVTAGQFALLVDDETVHIVDYADLEVLNTAGCDAEALVTDEDEPYTRYGCPVTDAVYDPARLKIYAATNSSLGVNGNSIAVIDAVSGAVERYAHIGSEPGQIQLSTDGNRLYAIFDGADTIAALDLNTFAVTRSVPLDYLPVLGADPKLEAQRARYFAVSPAENDALVVATTTHNETERFIAVRNGVVLDDAVLVSDMQIASGVPDRQPFFDGSGTAYSLASDGDTAIVESLLLGPSGLSLGSFFEVGPAFVGLGQFDVSQDEVFTAAGEVIDLAEQTGTARYDFATAANADVASGHVFMLLDLELDAMGTGDAGIARYDYLTGALLAEQRIDSFVAPFHGPSLFDVGADRLGVVTSPNPLSGLIIIDKAAIQ